METPATVATTQTPPLPHTEDSWVSDCTTALGTISLDGTIDDAVRAMLTHAGWDLRDTLAISGSDHWLPIAANEQLVGIVAARAGYLYLCQHPTTRHWATLWVPWCRVNATPVLLWTHTTPDQRRGWLLDAITEHTCFRAELGQVFDQHLRRVAEQPSERLRVYNPDLMACYLIFNLNHPDAEALLMLGVLGGWMGPSRTRRIDQPLLGRIRDIEFAARCGKRSDDTDRAIRAWFADEGYDTTAQLLISPKWAQRIAACRGFNNLPDILAPVNEDTWLRLVHAWCAAQERPV